MTTIARLLHHPGVMHTGLTLLHFLWQGAALGLVTLALLAALRRASAHARYLALLVVLAAMAVVPVVTFLALPHADQTAAADALTALRAGTSAHTSVGAPPLSAPVPTSARARVVAPSEAPPLAWRDRLAHARTWLEPRVGWIAAAWFAVVLALSLRLLAGWAGVRRAVRRASELSASRWQRAVAELVTRLRVTRPVRLLESAALRVPTVAGWLRPVILLPSCAIIGLTPEQIEALVAHELAHIRRHDYVVNLFQNLVEIMLFYHPAVWWVSRRIRVEREHCCDDLAVACCGDALAYAQALTEMESLRATVPQPALTARGGSLLLRIRRLVGPARLPPNRSASWLTGAIGLAVVIAVAVALSVSVMLSPGYAAKPAAKAHKPTPQEIAQAKSLIDEALATAQSIDGQRERDSALNSIAGQLATVDPERALQVARTIQDPERLALALDRIGDALALRHRVRAREVFAEAVRAAQRIEDEGRRDLALRRLSWGALPKVDSELALAIADLIKGKLFRVETLAAAARALTDEDRNRAMTILKQAAELAEGIEEERLRDSGLWSVSRAMAGLDPEAALRIALSIRHRTYRTLAVRQVVLSAAASDLEQALALARTVSEQTVRDRALQRTAVELAEKQPEKALEIARTIEQRFDFAYAAAVVSRVLARTDKDRSHALALEALRAAEEVTGPRARAIALRMAALALSRTDPERAIEVAQSIDRQAASGNPFWQAVAFRSIVLALAKTDTDRALEVARMIQGPHSRVEALLKVAAVAKKREPSRWAEIMREARKVAVGIENDYSRRAALSAVLRAAGREQVAARSIARASARDIDRIRDPHKRDSARLEWADSLVETDPDAALEIARTIEDPAWRASLMVYVAHRMLEGPPDTGGR